MGVSVFWEYVFPGGSSLQSRNAISADRIEADSFRRNDPEAYQARLNEKYIKGASEGSPAVISVNMLGASLAVLDFLARIHPYREKANTEIENIYVDLVQLRFPIDKPSFPDKVLQNCVGKGDTCPLIGLT